MESIKTKEFEINVCWSLHVFKTNKSVFWDVKITDEYSCHLQSICFIDLLEKNYHLKDYKW